MKNKNTKKIKRAKNKIIKKNNKKSCYILCGILVIVIIGIIIIANKNDINTNKMFTYLNADVNSELKNTYAFITKTNFDQTVDILALKKDNTLIKITTTKYSDWRNGIDNLFYSDGNIYFKDADDIINSIDLNKGNGNYDIKSYDFLEGYITSDDWFYVKDNEIYYFNSGSLHICDLDTEKCDYQNVDIKQDFEIKINNKKFTTDKDSVYIGDDLHIYILSSDEEDIYEIDINNPYDDDGLIRAPMKKIEKLNSNTHLVSSNSKLLSNNLKVEYDFESSAVKISNYGKKYKEINDCIPITLLPNNYLMAINSDFGSGVKFINLNNDKSDEELFDFNIYYNNIWFVEKN